MKNDHRLYYFLCNHWTEGGIGYAFPVGWYAGKKYEKGFSSVYTVEKMLDAADEYPTVKASMELDAYTYEVLSRIAPETVARLKEYIAAGKASVEGGTYGQPLGQDYGWEFNIRQLTLGRKTIQKYLDTDVRAFLVEEQWFHPQMPQLLLKSGFQYASLQNQNSGQVMPMNRSMILWKGLDGSSLPTIPANDIMVSCVRQYADYSEYEDRLTNQYEHPLLFQWVEIWVPGMDWGAGVLPFEKAIAQAAKWGAQPVSLGEYFEKALPGMHPEEVFIPLDESNYANDWYQGGGWGFDGDRVMTCNRTTEKHVMAAENLQWFLDPQNQNGYGDRLLQCWKDILILQNHDSSCARAYRAFDENGIQTTAGSLVVKKYADIDRQFGELLGGRIGMPEESTWVRVYNFSGCKGQKPIEIRLEGACPDGMCLEAVDPDGLRPDCVTCQGPDKSFCTVSFTDELPPFGYKDYRLSLISREPAAIQSGSISICSERILIEWMPGSWEVIIKDKVGGVTVSCLPFSGSIGKENEHDMLYPALSPAHQIFTFAFDGNRHCPDQRSQMRITGEVLLQTAYESRMRLSCSLVKLYTTETPAAFCEADITLNHRTDDIRIQLHLFAGAALNVNADCVFRHNLKEACYFRDYPFGEEQTKLDDIYANSYLRTTDGEGRSGFTILNFGTQRITLKRGSEGGSISHCIARKKLFQDYEWNFVLRFFTGGPLESLKLFKDYNATICGRPADDIHYASLYEKDNDAVAVSTHFMQDGFLYIRLINYSQEFQKAALTMNFSVESAAAVDFMECPVDEPIGTDGNRILMDFRPWEIRTVRIEPDRR